MNVFSSNSSQHRDKINQFEPDYHENSNDRKIYFAKVAHQVDSILGNINQPKLPTECKKQIISKEFSQAIKPIDQSKILSLVENKQQLNQNSQKLNLRSLTPIAEWEGYIHEVKGNEFFVKMVNINTKQSIPEDLATFSVNDVSEHDLKLLNKGAYVRFILGRERLPSGEIRNVSQLFFRRLPAHSRKDFDRAKQKAKDLLDSINWINETKTTRD